MDGTAGGTGAEDLKLIVSLLRSTLDSTTDGILVVDLQGKISLFNQRFAEMWRIPQRILDTKNDDAAIMHVLDQLVEPDRFIAKILELYAKPEAESFDVLLFKDGRIFERYSIPQRMDGRPAGRVWSFRDATERRLNEQALAESENRFRQMAENIRSVFYLALPDLSRILYVNPAYEKVWGLSCDSLRADADSRFAAVHPEDARRVRSILDANIGQGGTYAAEYRIQRPDGEIRWIWDRVVELKNEAGEIYRAVGIAEDITDRKSAEVERLRLLQREQLARARAEDAVRSRDDFLAIAAHELKTPVATMQIHLDGLMQAVLHGTLASLPAEKQRKMIEIAGRQIERLTHLIQLLLDVTRLEQGRLQIEPNQADLAQIVQASVDRHEPALKEAGLELTLDLPAPVVGHWDAHRLEQVVDNLLSNAMKYGQGHPVAIRVFARDGAGVLEVSDRGRGIPPEIQQRIFEKFDRGDLPAGFAGLGMGLYIAREIVAAHGGTIAVESVPGEGSLFRVELPIEK